MIAARVNGTKSYKDAGSEGSSERVCEMIHSRTEVVAVDDNDDDDDTADMSKEIFIADG